MDDELDGDGGVAQEWRIRQRRFHTLGYRDGVSAGKESSAQRGFNAGYCESIRAGCEWGAARGFTSAFAALSPSLRDILVPSDEVKENIESLHRTVSSITSTDAMQSYYRHLHQQQQQQQEQVQQEQVMQQQGHVEIWPVVSEKPEGIDPAERSMRCWALLLESICSALKLRHITRGWDISVSVEPHLHTMPDASTVAIQRLTSGNRQRGSSQPDNTGCGVN